MENNLIDYVKRSEQARDIINAYLDGKSIQYREKLYNNKSEWQNCEKPSWDFNDFEYRITPEYRPYTEEELINIIDDKLPYIKYKDSESPLYAAITSISSTGIKLLSTITISFEEAFNKFVWLDGTPFGILD